MVKDNDIMQIVSLRGTVKDNHVPQIVISRDGLHLIIFFSKF